MTSSRLFQLLFGFKLPVTRRSYIVAGFLLMGIKYLGELAVATLYFHKSYPPEAFLLPFAYLRQRYLAKAEMSFLAFQIVWSVPFMWIGVSMTARRAVDAGSQPIRGLLFLWPLLNYVVIARYATLPSKSSPLLTEQSASNPSRRDSKDQQTRVRAILVSIVSGAALCLPVLLVSTVAQSAYTTALFIGLPTAMGTVASWIWNQDQERSTISSVSVAISSVLLAGAFILLFALEGLGCMLMAAPFAAAGACLGGPLGQLLALHGRSRRVITTNAFGIITALLVLTSIEPILKSPPPLRSVTTEVLISAPPSIVWDHVVQFSEIESPKELLFRNGIAYPIRARIEGSGVGAVRHCEFSTGAFVEPITVWNPPHLLGFSVESQPPTMTELSLYRHLEPRHLTETFVSHRGQFELLAMDDGAKTLLRGTTWYTLDMAPLSYWTLWTDFFIHKIHNRVLMHIRKEVEAEISANAKANFKIE